MDFNRLYFDHQVLLMRAARIGPDDAGPGPGRTASLIAGRIGCLQRALGAAAAPGWEAIACGAGSSFAGSPSCPSYAA